MKNPFDRFDAVPATRNPFDQFDNAPAQPDWIPDWIPDQPGGANRMAKASLPKPITYQFEDEAPPASGITYQFEDDTTPTTAKPEPQPEMPWYQNLAVGAGKGLTDVGTGALQRVLEGGQMVRNALDMESNQPNIDRLSAITAENRRAFAPLAEQSTAANIGEFAGQAIPMAVIPGGVTGGALRRAGTSVLSGGATGALQPTTGNESATGNAVVGGLFGAGASGVMSGGGKVVNALLDRLPPNFREALAKRYGIRTTLGEATGAPLIQKAESWLESVPIIGIGGFRRKQHEEAEQAAKGFFAKYVIDPTLVKTSAMKEANDAYLDMLYANVHKTTEGLPAIPAQNVKQATGEMIDRFPSVFESIQDNHIKRILKNVYVDVEDTAVNTGLVNAQGAPVKRNVSPTFTFNELWELRKGIGAEIRDAKTETARGLLGKMYAAVSNDMEAQMAAMPDSPAAAIFRNANDSFKQYSVKFDVLRDAYDKAMGTTKAGEMFSPKKFATDLKNLAEDPNYKRNIRWTPKEIDEMTGLANVLQVVKRSSQYVENPATGARWGLPVFGIGAFASPQSAATIGGVVGITRLLTGTEYGKRLALAASKIEPESKNMKVIMKMIYNQLPKMAATGATRDF
jgi:hypothetical protein